MVRKDNKDYNFAIMVGGGTALAVLVVFFLALKPLYDKNVKLREEKTNRDKELVRLVEREKVLVNLKDRSAEIKADAERVSNALPSDGDIGRLFIQLDELAKVSGGNLKSVSENTSSTNATTNTASISESNYYLPIDMPSYFALKKFFESSEDALRLLSINDLKIDASEAGVLSVNIGAKAYTRLK